MDYNSWIDDLREVLQEKDSPLKIQNGRWEVKDRELIWHILGSRIFDAHLEQFKICAVQVLTELDPRFELPSEERYAASIHGKVLKHSTELRTGMAETIALIGSQGKALINCSQQKPETIAVLTIREILKEGDWQLWGSLNNLLPTLAEAAPGEFLSLVEDALQKNPCPFDELFAQEGSGITGTNYLTGLLWALESLSWYEEYLARVAVILAEMDSHDPGGTWANRPLNSIITILLPWLPQTLANVEKRIACIKAIHTDFPEVAWKVLLKLLPNQHQMSTGAHKPRFRKILHEGKKVEVTNKEYWEQVSAYAELAVDMACKDLSKLKELVNNLENLPKSSFNRILRHLSSKKITELSEDLRRPIWTSLTDLIRKHKKYADSEWALDDETVSRVEISADKLSPTSPEGLYQKLFCNNDFELYEEKGDWEEQRKKLDIRRHKAVNEVFKIGGLQGIIDFIDSVESPYQLGFTFASIATDEIDLVLFAEYLNVKKDNYQQFISGYIGGRYIIGGFQWVARLDRTNFSTLQNCKILLNLPFEIRTWELTSKWLKNSEKRYWQTVFVNPYQSGMNIFPAIDKLLGVNRPVSAINCLHYGLFKRIPFDTNRTVKALLSAASSPESTRNMDYHHISELIKALQENSKGNQDDLFKVEWAYLPLLDGHYGVKPKLLQERLANQPNFFCEVIRLIYHSKHELRQEDEFDETRNAIATNAWRLLNGWKRPPGLSTKVTFSKTRFSSWLRSVKKECTQTGHLEVAMLKVGEVLYYCPPDPKGLWIVREVAQALNARDADEMRRGFQAEVYNSRGIHWIEPTAQPEYKLAEQWREKAEAVENAGFVRFAAILRELAESYIREAERIIDQNKLR